VATGIAFDRSDTMYVGDRTGRLQVNGIGKKGVAQLELPFPLSSGGWPDEALYVTGPTVASFDSVMRVTIMAMRRFYRGLGVRKGSRLTATETFVLLLRCVAGGDRAHLSDGKDAEMFVAGMNLVGLAFSSTGDLAVASTDSIYQLEL